MPNFAPMEKMKVAVIGAGTMGIGIAQVAATAGHPVMLFDTNGDAVDKALAGLKNTLDRLVEKGRLTAAEAGNILGRIKPVVDIQQLNGSGLVIEAIVENLAVKQKLFRELSTICADHDEPCVFATNTSSLSVTAIAAACDRPERVIGLHFFNPAPLLPLVEVVPGLATAPDVVDRNMALMSAWGKMPVRCSDTPGFIVNRVARPFYGESIRIFEEGVADMAQIDTALRTIGGFRMGPFELMDLIGNDVNLTVTRTVWEAFFFDPRYKPSLTQQRQVESGRLGRKSGRGYYSYANGATAPQAEVDPGTGRMIVDRVLAMLINEAVDALFWKVASAADIDLAMTRGVNYPKGLLAWADELGAATCLERMEALYATYGEDRYRPSPLLRRVAQVGGRFSEL
jgi:3-hydroxybutyryl-CoA dehydrogenase